MSVQHPIGVMRKPRLWLSRFRLTEVTRFLSILFAVLGIASGVGSYLVLTNVTPIEARPETVWTLLSFNIFIIGGLLLGLGAQALRVRRRQRAGLAGARLHGRMIALFSTIAVLPAILVAVFAFVTLDRGLDYWFSIRTKTIIENTTAVANAYLADQRESLRYDLDIMTRDLSKASEVYQTDRRRFARYLEAQAEIRGLQQALLINARGDVLMAAEPETTILTIRPPDEAFVAASDKTVIITAMETSQILGLRQIEGLEGTFLYSARLMMPSVTEQLLRTDAAVRDYSAMEQRRFETQLTFALIYIILTLVILLSAIWLGLSLADRLVSPIGRLILMTRRLGEGDLEARVESDGLRGNDEIKHLAETFNEMAERLGEQQADLKETHADLDERNRFTEAVLAGVSSGVIGVDENGIINHANDVAGALYEQAAEALIGKPLKTAMPEFSGILAALGAAPTRSVSSEFNINNPALKGHIIRASAQKTHGVHGGAIITFDDITDLLTAQRNAAWADIARRIAHEIKNPLTPIQLSAERLQARYGRDADDDRDIFKQCTDTIIRQVEDIGNMVDEFASFARMPAARMDGVNLADVISETVLLQRVAHRDITYAVGDVPEVNLVGDRRLISQALTNILKNAEEAVRRADGEKRISLEVEERSGEVVMSVSDTGVGWPKTNRYELLEPYNTSREEGTGLGLSIVKKIVDDHGGKLVLSDAPWCASGGTGAMLQVVLPLQPPEMVGKSKMLEEI